MHINVSDAVGAKFYEIKCCQEDLFPKDKITNDSVLLELIQRSPYKNAAEELAQKKKQVVAEIHKKNNFKVKED